jgi:hypothetical protein
VLGSVDEGTVLQYARTVGGTTSISSLYNPSDLVVDARTKVLYLGVQSKIYTAALSGNQIVSIAAFRENQVFGSISGLALDSADGKLYLADKNNGKIQHMDVSAATGSAVTVIERADIASGPVLSPLDLELDLVSTTKRVYWCDATTIRSAPLSGTPTVLTIVAEKVDGDFRSLALDTVNRFVYYADGAVIRKAPMTGTAATSHAADSSYTQVIDTALSTLKDIEIDIDSPLNGGTTDFYLYILDKGADSAYGSMWKTPLASPAVTAVVSVADAKIYNPVGLSIYHPYPAVALKTQDQVLGVEVDLKTSTNKLALVEGGISVSFTVVLESPPADAVTVALSVADGTVTLSPSVALVFSATLWDTSQTVTASATANDVLEGLHNSTIALAVTSSDANYNSMAVPPINVDISDNDPRKIFWTALNGAPGSPAVMRSNLDGSGKEVVTVSNVVYPRGIFVEELLRQVIWVDTSTVETSGLDGSNLNSTYTSLTPASSYQLFDVCASHEFGRLFWADTLKKDTGLGYMPIGPPYQSDARSPASYLAVTNQQEPTSMALDVRNATLFWIDRIGVRVMWSRVPGATGSGIAAGTAAVTALLYQGDTGVLTRLESVAFESGVQVSAGAYGGSPVAHAGVLYATCSDCTAAYSGATRGRILMLKLAAGASPTVASSVDLEIAGLNQPIDVAADSERGHIYWLESEAGAQGRIKRCTRPLPTGTSATCSDVQLLASTPSQTSLQGLAIYTSLPGVTLSTDDAGNATVPVAGYKHDVVGSKRLWKANMTLQEGATTRYAVRLDQMPVAAVTVHLAQVHVSPCNFAGGIVNSVTGGGACAMNARAAAAADGDAFAASGDHSLLTLTPTTLTFTAANWATPQPVTVHAVNDWVAQGQRVATVTHQVSSSDAKYVVDSMASLDVLVVEDDVYGVTSSHDSVSVTEASTVPYSISLHSQPYSSVTVSLADHHANAAQFLGDGVERADGDHSKLTFSPNTFTFTPVNWNSSQVVTVTAVDDSIAQGERSPSVRYTGRSSDARYNRSHSAFANVQVNVAENDAAEVVISTPHMFSIDPSGTFPVTTLWNTKTTPYFRPLSIFAVEHSGCRRVQAGCDLTHESCGGRSDLSDTGGVAEFEKFRAINDVKMPHLMATNLLQQMGTKVNASVQTGICHGTWEPATTHFTSALPIPGLTVSGATSSAASSGVWGGTASANVQCSGHGTCAWGSVPGKTACPLGNPAVYVSNPNCTVGCTCFGGYSGAACGERQTGDFTHSADGATQCDKPPVRSQLGEFYLQLDSVPYDAVTIDVVLDDPTQAFAQPSRLVFNGTNTYSAALGRCRQCTSTDPKDCAAGTTCYAPQTPQTVFIFAQDDPVDELPLNITVTLVTSSGDSGTVGLAAGYDRLASENVTVELHDDDVSAMVVSNASNTGGYGGGRADDWQWESAGIELSENSNTAYSLRLTTRPATQCESACGFGAVTVDVRRYAHPDDHSVQWVDPEQLVFNSSNWDVPQNVTVWAVDDWVAQGNRMGVLYHSMQSLDVFYSGANSFAALQKLGFIHGAVDAQSEVATLAGTSCPVVPVSTIEDDVAGVTLSSTTITVVECEDRFHLGVNGGGTFKAGLSACEDSQMFLYTISLNTRPYNPVTMTTVLGDIANQVAPGLLMRACATGPLTANGSVVRPSECVTTMVWDGDMNCSRGLGCGDSAAADWHEPKYMLVAASENNIHDGTRFVNITSRLTSNDTCFPLSGCRRSAYHREMVPVMNETTGALVRNEWRGVEVPKVAVVIQDNETASVTIMYAETPLPHGRYQSKPENLTMSMLEGSSRTYVVKLSVKPNYPVTVYASVSDSYQLRVSPEVLTFTEFDYYLDQTVTITALDNSVADHLRNHSVSHFSFSNETGDVFCPVGSQGFCLFCQGLDPEGVQASKVFGNKVFNDGVVYDNPYTPCNTSYAGVTVGSVNVAIEDDDQAGVTVSLDEMVMVEGSSAQYKVVLNSEPRQNKAALGPSSTDLVVIDITPELRRAGVGARAVASLAAVGADVITTPSALTFSPAAWNVPQTVTVTAVDNGAFESFQAKQFNITHAVLSLDPGYNNRSVTDLAVYTTDDDAGCRTATPATAALALTSAGAASVKMQWDCHGVGTCAAIPKRGLSLGIFERPKRAPTNSEFARYSPFLSGSVCACDLTYGGPQCTWKNFDRLELLVSAPKCVCVGVGVGVGVWLRRALRAACGSAAALRHMHQFLSCTRFCVPFL